MRSVVDLNVVMRHMTVLSRLHISSGARDNSLPTSVTMSHSLLVTVTAVTKRPFSVRYAPYTLLPSQPLSQTCVHRVRLGTGPKKQLSVDNIIHYTTIRWQRSDR